MRRRKKKLGSKKLIFIILLSSLTFLSLELILSFLSRISPMIAVILTPTWVTLESTVPDKYLGLRGHPAYWGHDRNGFRNPYVPDTADIVVFGDSQTYGVNVRSREAWPKVLEVMLRKNVYNMAFPGYGPVHHLILWREASLYQPKIIIEALYSGNDLFDSFDLVYNGQQLPELKTEDPAVWEEIAEWEKSENLNQQISQLFNQTTVRDPSRKSALIKFLAKHSKSYGLSQRISYEVWLLFGGQKKSNERLWEIAQEIQKEEPGYFEMLAKGDIRTLFTSQYRLGGLNLKDPRIREGEQILFKAIARMNELAVRDDVKFLVLLIPTKEFVFREMVESPAADYSALVANEETFWNEAVHFFKERGIEYVDALPALREQFKVGKQPYHVTLDGHPNQLGHRAIAELLKERLSEDSVTASVLK